MGFSKILSVFLFLFAFAGHTGSSSGTCGEASEPAYSLEKHRDNINTMALELYNYLDAHVARVAIVARSGGDISSENFRYPRNQKYTHAGLAWKSSQDGKWRFRHVLNVCAGSSSEIFIQSLAHFFNDDPHFYDFVIAVPSEDLQEKIAAIIEDDTAVDNFHNPRYSNVANPFARRYQNSNGWILNILAAAESGARTIGEAMDYYTRMNYRPSQVEIGFLRRLGVDFVDNAHLDDHPSGHGGWFNFVSAESLINYLKQRGKLISRDDICHPSGCNIPLKRINN